MAGRDIVSRVEQLAGVEGLAERLAGLKPTDLQSLLLEVGKLRAARRTPAEVLRDFERSRFVCPSATDPRVFLELDRVAYGLLPDDVAPIALSPIAPLGVCSVVAGVSQNWAVTTSRTSEVVSDPTNVLALECAVRRRAKLQEEPRSAAPVSLAASHQVLRPQRFDGPLAFAHFRLFCLASAGRDVGGHAFEIGATEAHIRFYVELLRAVLGNDVKIRVELARLDEQESAGLWWPALVEGIESVGATETAAVPARPGKRAYYRDVHFRIATYGPSGEEVELIDGGFVDWTQQLLASSKERLLTSAIGMDRLGAMRP